MRRAGMLCVVLGLFAVGCGGHGRGGFAFQVTCGSAVAEGSTVRLTLEGNNFTQVGVNVEASAGTIAHLTVDSFDLLSFDYTAPTYPPGTIGPKTVTFNVSGGPGVTPSECSVTIHLNPFLASCSTTYPPDHSAAPTTGVADGAFVIATLNGGNFLEEGALVVQTRGGSIAPLTEIAPVTPFTSPGQFRVMNGTTIQLSVPDVFSMGAATILDGSPNTGPATLSYLAPFGVLASETGCFSYVSAFVDFADFRFELPGSVAGPGAALSTPGKVVVGDVNADGVPDIVVLAEQAHDAGTAAPEAFLLLANTFGPGVDRNGDGKTPDFAGSFTTQVINDPSVETWIPSQARGQSILLANLDDDPELEIILAVRDDEGDDGILLVDVEPGGTVGDLTVLRPSISTEYIAGLAVGDFDHASPHIDIAALYGDSTPANRKLVIFRSQDAFDYTSTIHDIPPAFELYRADALGAGDFDGDGDDDLIFGQYTSGESGEVQKDLPILVVRVDADGGTIGAFQQIANLTGSCVPDIEIFDANGDGRMDAVVFIGGAVDGTLPGENLGAGVATFLDPFELVADAFVETTYRFSFSDPAGNGRGMTHGDFNGDGITDVATLNEYGEVLVLLGNGDGTFTDSGQSWQVVTDKTDAAQVTQGLDAGDFDGDGLSEIVVGDMSNAPFNLVYYLNAAR